jgi:hypothetical protein
MGRGLRPSSIRLIWEDPMQAMVTSRVENRIQKTTMDMIKTVMACSSKAFPAWISVVHGR